MTLYVFHLGRVERPLLAGDGFAFTRSIQHRARTCRIFVVGPFILTLVYGR